MFVKMHSTSVPWNFEYSDQGCCRLLHLLYGLAMSRFKDNWKAKIRNVEIVLMHNICYFVPVFFLDTNTPDQLILIGTCFLHHYNLLYKEI
jgi:hypothetical protein